MTREDVVVSMRSLWYQIGANLLVDDEGNFDESKEYTGKDLQGMMGDHWINQDEENASFFYELIATIEGCVEWIAIKREAFPDDETYGA